MQFNSVRSTDDSLNPTAPVPRTKSPEQKLKPLVSKDFKTRLKRSEHILVVDDDLWVVEVIAKQLDLAGFRVKMTTDSSQVMSMLASEHYDLVISDVCMPTPDGLMLLKEIQKEYPFLAVLMLTGVNDVETATQAMLNGASDYIVKPHNETQLFLRVDRALERSRLLQERALYQQHLEKRVNQQTRKLQDQSQRLAQMLERLFVTYKATLNALQAALDVRDQSAPGHCRRVSKLAVELAKRMGFAGDDLINIEHGALLHDIGKLGIPDAILMKPGPLTEEERKMIEQHPEIGCQIVGDIEFLKDAIPIIRHHHERYDGTGYPEGLKGDEIPILARLFTIVDAYDAQTNQRPYNTILSAQSSLEILRASQGTGFDPRVVEAFIEMIEEEGET
jgi:putative nucleotidyltransferase with HDIG domain